MKQSLTTLVTLFLVVTASMTLPAPASADTETFEAGNTYLRSVTVANSAGPLRITIKVNKAPKIKVPSYSAEIDTDKGHRGGEFLVLWYTGAPASLGISIGPGSYDDLKCKNFKVTRLDDGVSRRFSVPRNCLTYDDKVASAVRVHVEGLGIKKRADGAWGCHPFRFPRKGFTGWVAQDLSGGLAVTRARQGAQSPRRGC